jgi:COP9 signalosome complex subunit 7
MPTIRDLEDLIIDAIYLDILRGKLDQKEQQLEVEYTMGRDLEPGKIEEVLAALKNWYAYPSLISFVMILNLGNRASTTSAVLSSLDNQLDSLASQGAVNAANNEEHEKAWQGTLKDILDKQKEARSGRKVLGGGGVYNTPFAERGNTREEPMDVDDAVVENKGKNRK